MVYLTYDVLFLDLDGTLLSAFKKISKKNLQALKYFSELGGKVVIATGKTYSNTKKYINQLNSILAHPIEFCACLNGNTIYDLRNNKEKIIYEGLIQNSDCKQIYHACKRNKVAFVPYTKNGVEKGNIHLTSGANFLSFFNRFNTWNIRRLDTYQTMSCYKINLFAKSFFAKKIRLTSSQLGDNKNIDILKTKKLFYEIVPHNSDKGNALKIICKHMKIPINKTVAVGDSHNDLPMFRVAGLAVSVKAKTYEFKKVCNFFVKSKRNKVANAINKYII